jgi:hypothetical protein
MFLPGEIAMYCARLLSLGGWLLAVSATASSAQPCPAPAEWFPHAKTPAPASPPKGADSCAFHRWSWQAFLWVTQTVDGAPRFIKDMHYPDEIFDQGYFATHPLQVAPSQPRLRLSPRDAKPVSARAIGAFQQAGNHGVLVDQHGRAIYYATHLNQTYVDFIRCRGYNDPRTLQDAPPADTFPVDTLMLKSSWRVLGANEDPTDFYTTTASIQRLKTDDQGQVVVDPDHPSEERVALVGLHVVGRVDRHPEFIWATFEHRRNAPQLPGGVAPGAATPVSDTAATFYAAGTPARARNAPKAGHVQLVSADVQTLRPVTHVFRQNAQGGADKDEAALIVSLNESVRTQLGTDLWANYELIGSLWSDREDGLTHNEVPGDQKGALSLANTTMETFQQSVGNCFSCHNTRGFTEEEATLGPKIVNLSHALRGAFVLDYQQKYGKKSRSAKGRAR